MNKTIALLLLLFSANLLIAQTDPLIGEWKVLSVDNGDFYWNIATDSLRLNEDLSLMYDSAEKLSGFRELARQLYFDQTFTFGEKGEYIQKGTLFTIESVYEIDHQNDQIMIYPKSENVQPDFFMPFRIENNLLMLEIPVTDPPAKLVLTR